MKGGRENRVSVSFVDGVTDATGAFSYSIKHESLFFLSLSLSLLKWNWGYECEERFSVKPTMRIIYYLKGSQEVRSRWHWCTGQISVIRATLAEPVWIRDDRYLTWWGWALKWKTNFLLTLDPYAFLKLVQITNPVLHNYYYFSFFLSLSTQCKGKWTKITHKPLVDMLRWELNF